MRCVRVRVRCVCVDAITRVMYEVCEDAVADGVRYLEVRFSPILHTKEGMSLSQVMEAICEGQLMAEHNLPILYAAPAPSPLHSCWLTDQ